MSPVSPVFYKRCHIPSRYYTSSFFGLMIKFDPSVSAIWSKNFGRPVFIYSAVRIRPYGPTSDKCFDEGFWQFLKLGDFYSIFLATRVAIWSFKRPEMTNLVWSGLVSKIYGWSSGLLVKNSIFLQNLI